MKIFRPATLRVSILFALSSGITGHVRADSGCKILLSPKTTVQATAGNAIEIELPVTRELIASYLDTTDGTLGPLFAGHGIADLEAIRAICAKAEIRLADGADPRKIRWRGNTFSQQKMLINAINRHLNRGVENFFNDRRIPGLIARSGAFEKFPLQGHVEYRGPKDLEDWQGVELHFRTERPPSQNLIDARRFTQKLVGIPTDLHAHLTAKSRWTLATIQDVGMILRHADFLRRTEMIAHMISLVDSRITIARNVTAEGIVNMGVLSASDLHSVVQSYLKARDLAVQHGRFHPPELHSKNFVGYRSEGAYSEPDLWGIEFRVLTTRGNVGNFQALLDGIQSTMHDPDFGVPDSALILWLEKEFGDYARTARETHIRAVATQSRTDRILRALRLKKALVEPTDAWLFSGFAQARLAKYVADQYPVFFLTKSDWASSRGQADYARLLSRFDDQPELKALWRTYLQTAKREAGVAAGEAWLTRWNESHLQLGYLLHAWEKDAQFVGQTATLEKIRRARIHALRELNRGASSVEAVRGFLLDSGIYEAYLAGFGARFVRAD